MGAGYPTPYCGGHEPINIHDASTVGKAGGSGKRCWEPPSASPCTPRCNAARQRDRQRGSTCSPAHLRSSGCDTTYHAPRPASTPWPSSPRAALALPHLCQSCTWRKQNWCNPLCWPAHVAHACTPCNLHLRSMGARGGRYFAPSPHDGQDLMVLPGRLVSLALCLSAPVVPNGSIACSWPHTLRWPPAGGLLDRGCNNMQYRAQLPCQPHTWSAGALHSVCTQSPGHTPNYRATHH